MLVNHILYVSMRIKHLLVLGNYLVTSKYYLTYIMQVSLLLLYSYSFYNTLHER